MNSQGRSVRVSQGTASSPLLPLQYQGRQVRVITDEQGAPWFVAADVCSCLELSNPSDALSRLDDDEKTLISNEGARLGIPPSQNLVNEPGLYSLILGSRKPEARAFKRWVTHEVLPAIRTTGSYGTAPTLTTQDVERICTETVQRILGAQRLKPRRQPSLTHVSANCAFCGKPFEARSISAVFCSAKCRVYASRHRRQGKPFPAAVSTALTIPATPSLAPGIHVVANNQRHANWLWGQAVEAHVSAALMRSMSHDTQHRIHPSHFQLHLLPSAS